MGMTYAKPMKLERPARSLDENSKGVDLKTVPIRVDRITVNGLKKCNDHFIKGLLKGVFDAKNFQELIVNAHKGGDNLEKTGCFKTVSIYVDTSESKSDGNGVEVKYVVSELGQVCGSVSTNVGNNEANLLLRLRGPNLFGNGEKLQFEYSIGSKNTSNLNLTMSKPIWQVQGLSLSGSVFQQSNEFPASYCSQTERGFNFDINFGSSDKVKHKLQYEAAWRELSANRDAAFEIREDSGHTLKSSLKHIICIEKRDAFIFPTRGYFTSFSNEFAGIGGNIGFFKSCLFSQFNIPLPKRVVFQATTQLGFVHRMFESKTIGLSDKFFFGGPMSVRGFHLNGIGPQVDKNFLGATHSWGFGLHLFAPLPYSRPGGFFDLFRFHCFTTLGNLENVDMGESFKENLKSLAHKYRLSYGCGLAIRLSQVARVEINYTVPVYYKRTDLVTPGVQFGIGVQFL